MSDITDAALVGSLRATIRELRREIAGLREERRAILDADRPMCDRPEAINTGESDRPKPICTPEPHATPGECSVPPKCTDTGGE